MWIVRSKYIPAPVNAMFGKWRVLGYSHFDNEHYWDVKCTSCENNFKRRASQLNLGRSKGCQSCNSFEREKYSFWKGIDGISFQYITRLKYRKHKVSIELQDIVDKWHEQKGLCVYSKEPLSVVQKDNSWTKSTASLDRIDSSKGYIKDNIQWVHKEVNLIKQNLSEDRFLYWINKIQHGGSCGV